MARTPKKPAPFAVGPVRVRAIRGPHPDSPKRWYWRAERSGDGTRWTVWTGWGTAAEAIQAVAALVAAGEDEAPREAPRAQEVTCETVRDLLELWMGHQEDRHERGEIARNTHRGRLAFCRHIARVIGAVRLDRVSARTLEQHQGQRVSEGATTHTLSAEVAVLLTAWRWGVDLGLCPQVILRAPRARGRAPKVRHVPTQAEFEAVLAVVDAAPLARWRGVALRFLRGTGARVGEMAALRWEAVDLDAAEVTISGKTGARTISIPAWLVDALAEWREAGGASSGPVWGPTPATVNAHLRRAIQSACVEAGCPLWGPHSLRDLVANEYRRAGVDLTTYSAQMGHSPTVALRHYQRATPDDRRRAAAALNLSERGAVIPFPQGARSR